MKNKSRLHKILIVALLLVNISFLIYWSILAFYSRPHYDDLHFLWKMREMSIFEYVKEMYFSRSGRFVGYGINGIMSVITNTVGFHQLWTIIYYAAGLGLCWLVVKDGFRQISRLGLFLGMCFIYNLYVLTNIDFPVFTWLCAMVYYLSLPMAILLLKYLNQRELNWKQWLLFAVLIVLIGGGSEAFTPIVLLLMFFNGMYYWHSKDWNVQETWALPQVRRIVWTAVALLVMLTIVVVAPGNYLRMNTLDDFVHPVGISGWLKAMANAVGMFLYFMAFYVPYYLIAFVLAYYAGSKSYEELPFSRIKLVVWIGISFVAFMVLSSLPNVYLYGGFGIQRTFTPVVFALILAFVASGYVLGVGRRSNWAGWCSICGLIVMFVIMCVNIAIDAPTAREYGCAVDDRIEKLCSLRDKGQKETVTVAPLPVPYTEDVKHRLLTALGKDTPMSVLYYISDTDTVPNEYEGHMKHLLKLDFDFVLPKKGDAMSQE